jgi:cytochrome c oxidase assembly protein subunit 19
MNLSPRQGRDPGIGSGPQQGSFPLDHLHECDTTVERYYRCLRENHNYTPKCRDEVREYLVCRRKNELMTENDYKAAGIRSKDAPAPEFDWNKVKEEERRRKLAEPQAQGIGKSGRSL